jgi:hypothetical protein
MVVQRVEVHTSFPFQCRERLGCDFYLWTVRTEEGETMSEFQCRERLGCDFYSEKNDRIMAALAERFSAANGLVVISTRKRTIGSWRRSPSVSVPRTAWL